MADLAQTVEITPLERLAKHPRNPRRSDVGKLADSIRANGFYGVVVAQRSTGHILVGNHRVDAAREVGLTEIPVAWVDVDDAAAMRILLVDNRTSDEAGYDQRGLAEVLRELQEGGSLDGTGFDEDALIQLERVSGMLGEERASWLDRFLSQEGRAPENDQLTGDVGDEEARRRAGLEGTAEQFFSVSYMYPMSERAEVVGVLNRVRQAHDLETASQALLVLCRWWAEQNPVEEAPDA